MTREGNAAVLIDQKLEITMETLAHDSTPLYTLRSFTLPEAHNHTFNLSFHTLQASGDGIIE